jgi:hypothetical protein
MPNILPIERHEAVENGRHGSYVVLTLDDVRREPGRLVFLHELALMGIVSSYDAARRWIKTGRLPDPYRLGSRKAWEGRAILKAIGASEVQENEPVPIGS